MYISEIAFKNFKGNGTLTKLTPVTIICGENGKHKSARLEAAQIALSGYMPMGAKKPNDIYATYASASPMSVGVVMDDGKHSARQTFTLSSKGSVSRESKITGWTDDFTVPSVLFDQNTFLDLSATERTKYLFKLLPPPSLEKVGPQVIVTNLKNWKGEPHTEHHEKVIGDVCLSVQASFDKSKHNGESVQEWLSSLVETIKLKANSAKASAKQFKATILGVSQLRSPDEASIAQSEQAKGKARTELDAINKTVATISEQLRVCRENYKAKKAASDEATRLATGISMTNLDAEISVTNDAITKLRQQTEKSPDVEALRKLKKGSEQAALKANDLKSDWRIATSKLNALKDQQVKAKKAECCATCGQSLEGVKREMLKTLKDQIEDGEKTEILHGKVHDKAQSELERINKLVEAESAIHTAHNDSLLRIGELMALLTETQAKRVKIESCDKLKSELDVLEAEGYLLKEKSVMNEAEQTVSQTRFNEAESKHRQAVADASAARSQLQAAQKADEAQAEADVITALQDFLVELLSLCVVESVKPLVEKMQKLYPIAAFQDGELGITPLSMFVPWKACSDSEQLLLHAAVRVALASYSHTLRVACVARLESCDEIKRSKLIARIMVMIEAGELDQFIAVQVGNPIGCAAEYAGFRDDAKFSIVACQ